MGIFVIPQINPEIDTLITFDNTFFNSTCKMLGGRSSTMQRNF